MGESVSTAKFKSLPELKVISQRLRKQGKRVVLCHGVFDLIHLGHIRHFRSAGEAGDVLIVTITADRHVKRGPGRPVFSEKLRAEALASLEMVDYVAIVDEPTAIAAITGIKPAIYAKGPDYRQKDKDVTGKIFDEEEAVLAGGGTLLITDDVTFSSSHLLNHHFDPYPPTIQQYLGNLAKKYSMRQIEECLEQARGLRVLVVGDAIIDQYHYCMQMGKSSKEPLVVSKYLNEEAFAGGVFATANHVTSFVNRVGMVTVLGSQDSWRDFIRSHIGRRVRTKFFYRRDAGTTIKRRYVSTNRQLKIFEIYFMNDELLPHRIETQVSDHLAKVLPTYDLVVVNDFGHGFLTQTLIDQISAGARKLALNVQTNSANSGFNLITKYPRADYVCVDELELRYATHDRYGEIEELMKQVHKRMKCELLITTRGREGSVSYSRRGGFTTTPSFAAQVVDPIGAGDAFFAATAPLFAAGVPEDLVAFIGNVTGSLAVQVVGNRETVQYADVLKFVTRLLK